MGEGFAGDVEHAGRVHIADGEDDPSGLDDFCRCRWIRRIFEFFVPTDAVE